MFCALPVYFEKSLFCKGEGFPQEVAVGKPVIMQGAEMLCQEESVKCTSPLPVCAVQCRLFMLKYMVTLEILEGLPLHFCRCFMQKSQSVRKNSVQGQSLPI